MHADRQTTMNRISSRFKRTSKNRKDGAEPAIPAPLTVPPRPSTSIGERVGPTNSDAMRPHPTLTITTTPTPPRTSHGNNNGNHNLFAAPKSPFRAFHLRSSNKRARSPAPAALPEQSTPAVVSHDGTAELEMTSPSKENRAVPDTEGNSETITKVQPKIPAFLTQSEEDILTKYQEIVWEERNRMLQSINSPEPTHKFARVDSSFRHLDRYQNIQPWSNNRVKLNVPDGTINYINASPVVLTSRLREDDAQPHRYIAMQGPKKNTLEHAWRMVAEQLESPAVIVMLTETHEGVMEKCFPYFPHALDETIEIGEDDEFHDGFRAQVKCVAVESMAEDAIEVRKLSLRVESSDEEMQVWHLLYKRWPDFGVPLIQDLESFFELMSLSRSKNASPENPRIVHCSAGVGRSGTFIALEHLVGELDSGELENYDRDHGGETAEAADLIFDTVNALREQRKMMVQSEAQFVFIYQVLRKLWIEKYGALEENGEPAAKRLGLDLDPFTESKEAEE